MLKSRMDLRWPLTGVQPFLTIGRGIFKGCFAGRKCDNHNQRHTWPPKLFWDLYSEHIIYRCGRGARITTSWTSCDPRAAGWNSWRQPLRVWCSNANAAGRMHVCIMYIHRQIHVNCCYVYTSTPTVGWSIYYQNGWISIDYEHITRKQYATESDMVEGRQFPKGVLDRLVNRLPN